MTADDVRELLADACSLANGVRSWARQHKLSAAYVSDVRHGNRPIGPRILKALGVEVSTTTTYRRVRK
jgi:hypothetical protein